MSGLTLPEPDAADVRLPPPRFSGLRTISALILREMGSTYGRSPGGYLWAILEPIGMIVILSVAFSLLVRAPSLGTSFMLFYATGLLPFNFYREIMSKTSRALRYASSLLAYPRVTWIDVILARTILAVLTEILTMCIVYVAILVAIDAPVIVEMGPILICLILAACLGLGVGLLNSLLSALFPLWRILWGMVTRPLLLASGVLYILEDMPRLVRDILWYNPLIHVTALMRKGFYPTYDATFVSITYVLVIALSLIALGLLFMRSWYKLVLEQ